MPQPGHAVLPQIQIANEASGALSTFAVHAFLDLDDVSGDLDTIVESRLGGTDGNEITVAAVADLVDGIAATTVLTAASNAARANAFNTLTFTGQPSDTQTVTINGTVYTFLTILIDAPGNVLIGSDAEDSLVNLRLAVTAGAGAGTKYGTGTTAHATVALADAAGTVSVATAKSPGTGGNALTASTTVTGASWTAGTFAGGATAGQVVLGAKTYKLVDYLAAANDVLRAATASLTLDNLDAAIDAAAGEGTTYGTGTTANAQVGSAQGAGDTLDITADAEGTAGNSIASTTTISGWSFTGTTLAGGIASGGLPTIEEDVDALTVVIHYAPNDTTVLQVESAINSDSTLIRVKTAGTAGEVLESNDAFAATALAGGTAQGANIPAAGRRNKAFVIVRRGASASGAVTVANARLYGRLSDEDGEEYVRFAELGTMSLLAAEDSRAVLVEGVGCWERIAFDCDAISSDTIDVDILFVDGIQA